MPAPATRIESLSVLNAQDGTSKIYCAELYDYFYDTVTNYALSTILKNKLYPGTPVPGGSITIRRMAMGQSKAYGTARAAGKGDAPQLREYVVPIDKRREIIEEIEDMDVAMLPATDVINRKITAQGQTAAREMDRAFFATAITAGTMYTPESGAAIDQIVDGLLDTLCTVSNQFVDGVSRDQIALVCAPSAYSLLRNKIDQLSNPNVDTTPYEYGRFHGARIYQSIHVPTTAAFVAMALESLLQPIAFNQFEIAKSPYGFSTIVKTAYAYGTGAVTPDLIYYVTDEALQEALHPPEPPEIDQGT
ncbi:MAG: hypothetical protein LBB86_01565 [Oscillospiraceae bacterium]|jgi:hypothetical protein|nr:hypothetical protein [Oscillospiraceae bacterium]